MEFSVLNAFSRAKEDYNFNKLSQTSDCDLKSKQKVAFHK